MASRGLIADVATGVTAPIRGFRFLMANPSLKRLAVVPLAINAVIFTVAILVFVQSFGSILGLASGILAVGTGAEMLEEPAAAFAAALAEALVDDSPLSADERAARSGLANRQVTLR